MPSEDGQPLWLSSSSAGFGAVWSRRGIRRALRGHLLQGLLLAGFLEDLLGRVHTGLMASVWRSETCTTNRAQWQRPMPDLPLSNLSAL